MKKIVVAIAVLVFNNKTNNETNEVSNTTQNGENIPDEENTSNEEELITQVAEPEPEEIFEWQYDTLENHNI